MTLLNLLLLATALFVIGLAGMLMRKTALGLFLAIEIMFNAANLLFVAFARIHGVQYGQTGQAFVFMILGVAAAEAAVGISLVLAIIRRQGTLNIDELKQLKW